MSTAFQESSVLIQGEQALHDQASGGWGRGLGLNVCTSTVQGRHLSHTEDPNNLHS